MRAAGYCLRAQREEDHPFLERLYISVRFLADQFRLQTTHYRTHYYDAEFLIVERSGSPVGRLYVFRGPHDHRVIDISLLPETRNAGVGGALLQAVKAEAAADERASGAGVRGDTP